MKLKNRFLALFFIFLISLYFLPQPSFAKEKQDFNLLFFIKSKINSIFSSVKSFFSQSFNSLKIKIFGQKEVTQTKSPTPQSLSVSEWKNWEVISEGVNESKYKISIGNQLLEGIELNLFSSANGDINKDFITIRVFGLPQTVNGQTIEPILGWTKAGFENDNRETVGGAHVLYYILPQRDFVNYIEITLSSPNGNPHLILNKSFARKWEPFVDYVTDAQSSAGWSYYLPSNQLLEGKKGGMALFACGAGTLHNCPMESNINYYLAKRFKLPKREGKPEIYIETGYVGGINVAPESAYGASNFQAKVNAGVGQGFWINEAEFKGKSQTLWQIKHNPAAFATEQSAEAGASAMIDILIDIGEDFVQSPAGRLILKALSYLTFVYDVYSLVGSLDYNEIVSESKRVVFSPAPVDPNDDNLVYVWLRGEGVVRVAGLSGIELNFIGQSPFGDPLLERLGDTVWNLPEGGFQIGGILLHYHIPRVVEVQPVGENLPVNSTFTIKFTKPINIKSLLEQDSIIVDYHPKREGFYFPFHYNLSSDGRTLYLIPNYRLHYDTFYKITLSSKIQDTEGFSLEPFEFSFTTEKNPNPQKDLYIKISVMSYSGKEPFSALNFGDIFEVIPTDIPWSEYEKSLREQGGVQGLMRTTHPNFDCYNEEKGFIFTLNNKFYFAPYLSKTCPYKVIFELTKKLTPEKVKAPSATIEIKYFRGNAYVAEQVGIKSGAIFNLEPITYQEYSAIGDYFANGIFHSKDFHCLDGKELKVYALIRSPFATIPDKPEAMFSVNFVRGISSSAPVDFVVYSPDENCKGAWRFVK